MFPPDYPTQALHKLQNEVLTAIERSEEKLLNWGFVDIKSDLTTSLPDLIESLSEPGRSLWLDAQRYGITPEDILEDLVERKLVLPDLIQKNLYRSRFAETIRLFSLLRQRFSPADWQTGSRLVSDIKIYLQPRRYPKRDIASDELINELSQLGATTLYREAITYLLKDDDQMLSLARFQKEAIVQQYRALHPGRNVTPQERGIVIGAGTGSGKTKAFYIPAMAEIAATLEQEAYVQALAIYPRVELLKDQLAEAFIEARKLDSLLKRERRQIIIGAYYGDTPGSAKGLLTSANAIRTIHTPQGQKKAWECPFFLCPDCKHEPLPLLWYQEDMEQEKAMNQKNEYGTYAILRCRKCYFHTEAGQFALTRDQMDTHPPDILFTTTEMLNRCLAHAYKHKLFGIGSRTPKMLLLDEIHTHEGLNGAHIAYLLRRWRNARREGTYGHLCCVGLSATLKNADTFFASLTGLSANHVNYIYPELEDMEVEGAEYNIILKSDPVSGTSVLSTSVQTVMLLARMLDVNSSRPSEGFYGQRIFSFTDKLDLVNRWSYTLIDAESKKLSQYRRLLPEESDEIKQKKYIAGQLWDACEEIGHPLNEKLIVDVTSSQNRGVSPNARIILATSSLEVGFNDPTTGAVVQHRAPHSLASFLQRKGRAGRSRRMRPWMVTVTSDYGRDRWVFQHAEALFQPELKDIDLPLDNYYALKMQAAFALMDWLALLLKQDFRKYSNIWVLLNGKKRDEKLQGQREMVIRIIKEVLDGTRLNQLKQYLKAALSIDQKTVDSLLWDEPRSLLFEVLPTILRQLETKWQKMTWQKTGKQEPVPWADNIADYPMPEFVTPNLFSDLSSPGIPIQLPENKEETLPLTQCLIEFAPGNVSKRYSFNRNGKDLSHWLELPPKAEVEEKISVTQFKNIIFDEVPIPLEIGGKDFLLYQPRRYTLQKVPQGVKNTSSAYLSWHSHFAEKRLLATLEEQEKTTTTTHPILSMHSKWCQFFTEVQSYTQAEGNWAEIARLATGVQVDTRYEKNKPSRLLRLTFEEDGMREGIGFINCFDALRFQFQPLDVKRFMAMPSWKEHYQTLGQQYFLSRLRLDPRMNREKLSRFEIERLWELEMTLLVSTAIQEHSSLEQAAQLVSPRRLTLAHDLMRTIFQAQQAEDYDEERVGRLQERLEQLLENQQIRSAIEDCEQVLWDQRDSNLPSWLQQCYAFSLGSTLFAALTQLTPDIDPDDLVMDIDGNAIWISEMTPGGIGIISKIESILELKPYEFDLQMLDKLQYCDRQQLATQLDIVTDLIAQKDQDLLLVFSDLRRDADLAQQEIMLERLQDTLDQNGVTVTRELIVAIRAKFLRPNSDWDTDELIVRLVNFWRAEEERLGCAIDLRVITAAALKNQEIREQAENVLRRIISTDRAEENQIFNILQSLLWLPCLDSCPDCIEKRHQYQELIKPSRAILMSLLQGDALFYGQRDWEKQCEKQLKETYRTQISCMQDQLSDCKQQVLEFLVNPVEIGFQFFYPVVERITRAGRVWTIEISIREFAHA